MEADNRGVTTGRKDTRPTLELLRVGVCAVKALTPPLRATLKL